MLIQGVPGQVPTQSMQPSQAGVNLRLGNMGDLIASELHGRYYEAAYRNSMFCASNQAAVTTTAGFATTYTGFCLTNPIGSSVNLVMNKVSYANVAAASTAALVGLMKGFNAVTQVIQTTPLTVYGTNKPTLVGAGLAASAVTLPTAPVLVPPFIGWYTATLSNNQPTIIDLEGSQIIPPGGYFAFYTGSAETSGFLFGMDWEEVPV